MLYYCILLLSWCIYRTALSDATPGATPEPHVSMRPPDVSLP